MEIYPTINPLTPRSDRCVNSPYTLNTVSSIQVIKIKKIIKGYGVDITPHFQD